MITRRTLATFKAVKHSQNDFTQSSKRQNKTNRRAAIHRGAISHNPKTNSKTKTQHAPVCKNKRSYELITRRTASDTGKVFYKCQICRKITNGYGNLNKHCRIHTGEKPYHCTVCGKAFSDKSGYDVHYRIYAGIKPYKCSVCKREFRSSILTRVPASHLVASYVKKRSVTSGSYSFTKINIMEEEIWTWVIVLNFVEQFD